jgi:hypothetical protein
MKNVTDMSFEEFSVELKRLNKTVLEYKINFQNGVVDMRKHPRSTRHYRNAQRGNFQGTVQKGARQQLKTLIGTLASGKGKYD